MSDQSKVSSLLEAISNTAAGFLFSFLIQKTLNHAYDVNMSNETAAWFVFWFTVASVSRSYVIRRIWNGRWKQALHERTTHQKRETNANQRPN